jgi:hypothetical protein
VAVSRHDATPLTSEELVHHLRGRSLLRDDRYTAGATQMAVAIGGCGGALQAAAALETLAAPAVAVSGSLG